MTKSENAGMARKKKHSNGQKAKHTGLARKKIPGNGKKEKTLEWPQRKNTLMAGYQKHDSDQKIKSRQ